MSSLALNVAFDLGRSTKTPFRLFCANEYSDRPGEIVDHLVVRKGSGITRLEDLKGKRVGAFPGSVTRIFVFGALAKHGIAEGDVTYTELIPRDWEPALVSGSVDAAFVMEPQATQILDHGTATAIASGFLAQYYPDAPLSGHWVTERFAEGPRRELARRAVRAYDRALDFTRANPAEAKAALRQVHGRGGGRRREGPADALGARRRADARSHPGLRGPASRAGSSHGESRREEVHSALRAAGVRGAGRAHPRRTRWKKQISYSSPGPRASRGAPWRGSCSRGATRCAH